MTTITKQAVSPVTKYVGITDLAFAQDPQPPCTALQGSRPSRSREHRLASGPGRATAVGMSLRAEAWVTLGRKAVQVAGSPEGPCPREGGWMKSLQPSDLTAVQGSMSSEGQWAPEAPVSLAQS